MPEFLPLIDSFLQANPLISIKIEDDAKTIDEAFWNVFAFD